MHQKMKLGGTPWRVFAWNWMALNTISKWVNELPFSRDSAACYIGVGTAPTVAYIKEVCYMICYICLQARPLLVLQSRTPKLLTQLDTCHTSRLQKPTRCSTRWSTAFNTDSRPQIEMVAVALIFYAVFIGRAWECIEKKSGSRLWWNHLGRVQVYEIHISCMAITVRDRCSL
jgi:hypothetical protein